LAELNKTEKATPKKRKDERKKGNAFQSKDAISIVVLIISFVAISKFGAQIAYRVENLYMEQLGRIASVYQLTPKIIMQIMLDAMMVFTVTALPIMLIISAAVILTTGAQTRFLVSGELLRFKYSRISFIEGFKRLLSIRSLVELAKSLMKISIIIILIYMSLKKILYISPNMLDMSMGVTLQFMIERIMSLVYSICLIFIVVAIMDYTYQWYDYEKRLKMSKQEVKDEYKQTEGDPFIKSQIKERQRKISMNRMIQQVPKADVIVRNPTHFAVALKYDINKDFAPIVLAKGQDHVALRIIEAGKKSNVQIVENRPLARGLYEMVEINDYIPAELYQAVAELMAWVYGNKEKEKKQL
jgi:flagellar biosynthesis protein FlhB